MEKDLPFDITQIVVEDSINDLIGLKKLYGDLNLNKMSENSKLKAFKIMIRLAAIRDGIVEKNSAEFVDKYVLNGDITVDRAKMFLKVLSYNDENKRIDTGLELTKSIKKSEATIKEWEDLEMDEHDKYFEIKNDITDEFKKLIKQNKDELRLIEIVNENGPIEETPECFSKVVIAEAKKRAAEEAVDYFEKKFNI